MRPGNIKIEKNTVPEQLPFDRNTRLIGARRYSHFGARLQVGQQPARCFRDKRMVLDDQYSHDVYLSLPCCEIWGSMAESLLDFKFVVMASAGPTIAVSVACCASPPMHRMLLSEQDLSLVEVTICTP